MSNLTDKYNIAVPRYTSYPPANYFENNSIDKFLEVIDRSNVEGIDNISLYFHIPFCRHLCLYCGCNSFAMPNELIVESYLSALHKEIDMLIQRVDKRRKISQIHFGGGSPTALPFKQLGAIIDRFRELFKFTDDAEIAVECHPAYLDADYWQGLVDVGFNRVSIGVQDFDNNVLKGVNRRASKLEMEDVFSILRKGGVSINLDFIYGLPHQSVESFEKSIKRCVLLNPDRVVTFSYAHVPWVNPLQKALEREGLPSTEEKSAIYDRAKSILCDAGYLPLGLDHFVKEGDVLAQGIRSGELHRNFQGYCTRHTTGQVYAFGVSAITQLNGAYIQNIKSVKEYITTINSGEFAYDKGYILSDEQQIVSDVITTLMCNKYIEWSRVATLFGLTVEEVKEVVGYDKSKFEEFSQDGLVVFTDDVIEVTVLGAKYIRNIAASLDPLMKVNKKSFSKSL